MVIGAVIINHKFCLSDVETVLQIQENPYMQYFVGLAGFQMEKPFASSLFVEIRKRMGRSVFEGFHQVIIEAHDGEKEKIESKLENQKKFQPKSQDEHGDYSSTVSEDDDGIQKEVPTHQGKLIDWNWNEDRCSISKGYDPENITCLRRFATGLIKSISKDNVSSTIKKLARNVRRVFDYLRMTNNSRKIIC